MSKEKVISILLMDGEITGRIKCNLPYSNILAYKVPKDLIKLCSDIEPLQRTGIYFLFGTDDEANQTVYIGQAGYYGYDIGGKGLYRRVTTPHTSKKHEDIDWTEAIMFTTMDNSFGPTELNYLENRFYSLVQEAGRYVVVNEYNPNPGNATEEQKIALEQYVDYARILLDALGYKVMQPYKSMETGSESDEKNLHMKVGQGFAYGERTREGFVIFKGSNINPKISDSCPLNVKRMREDFADKIKGDELISDIPMPSPSAASSFVSGVASNGLHAWKNNEDIMLKDIDA